MTLPVTARKSGPYSCNGSLQDFDFGFKVFAEGDVQVILTDDDGIETILTITSDYAVALNADQENDPGGTITTAATYATGNKITIIGDLDYGQPTQLTNRGGFFPKVIERAMDRLGILVQQLKEQVDRSVKVDASSTTDPDDLIDDLIEAAADAEAAAVAAAASYDSFDDRYLGSKTSNPSLDNDGNALLTGALYWNSVASQMRVYDSAAWQPVAQTSNYAAQTFSGTGAQTAFTLANPPVGASNLFVYISGVRQVPTTDYTLSGSTLTFLSAPPLGTNNIFTLAASTQDIGVPSDDTVSTVKIQDEAVTTAKIDDDAVTAAKIAAGAVGLVKLGSTAIAALGAGIKQGLILSNNTTDATNDIDIAAGKAVDTTSAVVMSLASLMVKRLDADWAAGTNQGGRYSGAAIADTTYHVWLVSKAAGADVDLYFDPSADAATVLGHLQAEPGGADYLYLWRIGRIVRVSNAIKAFAQFRDEVLWLAAVLDVDTTSADTNEAFPALTVGTGVKTYPILNVFTTSGGSDGLWNLSSPDVTNAAASRTAAPLPIASGNSGNNNATTGYGANIRTNTSGQIRVRCTATGATLRIATLGFIDPTIYGA